MPVCLMFFEVKGNKPTNLLAAENRTIGKEEKRNKMIEMEETKRMKKAKG